MPQKFKCSHCGSDLIVLKLDSGKFAECPQCHEWNEVPHDLVETGDMLNCKISKKEHVDELLARNAQYHQYDMDREARKQKEEEEEKDESDISEADKSEADKTEADKKPDNEVIPEEEMKHTDNKPGIEKEKKDPMEQISSSVNTFLHHFETQSPQENIDISLDPDDSKHILTFRDYLKQITPRIYVTPALIIINTCVFLFMILSGISPLTPELSTLIPWGIKYSLFIIQNGEWWRLVTSLFIHIGIFHLIMNMVVLWVMGSITERLYGSVAFGLIYLISGLGGNVASLFLNTLSESAGTTNAIMGIVGALIPFLMNKELPLPKNLAQKTIVLILLFSGISFMLGLFVTFIDNVGHVGGFLSGFGIAFLFKRNLRIAPGPHHDEPEEITMTNEAEKKKKYLWVSGIGVLLLLIGIAGGNFLLKPFAPILQINEFFRSQEYEQALNVVIENPGVLKEIPDGNRIEAIIYGNAGWERYLEGDFSGCITLSEKAYAIDPVVALYARYNIALCHVRLGFIDKAKTLYTELENAPYKIDAKNREGSIQDLKDLINKGVNVDAATSILKDIFKIKDID